MFPKYQTMCKCLMNSARQKRHWLGFSSGPGPTQTWLQSSVGNPISASKEEQIDRIKMYSHSSPDKIFSWISRDFFLLLTSQRPSLPEWWNLRYDYSTTLSEEFAMFTKYYQARSFQINPSPAHVYFMWSLIVHNWCSHLIWVDDRTNL